MQPFSEADRAANAQTQTAAATEALSVWALNQDAVGSPETACDDSMANDMEIVLDEEDLELAKVWLHLLFTRMDWPVLVNVQCFSLYTIAMSVVPCSHLSDFGHSSSVIVVATPGCQVYWHQLAASAAWLICTVHLMIAYLQGLYLLRSSPRRTASGCSFLEQLPNEIMETVLSSLHPQTLVQLHAATARGMLVVRQRLNASRCARHWLQLSRRMPPRIGTPAFTAYKAAAAQLAAYRSLLGPQVSAEETESEVSEAVVEAASENGSVSGSSRAASAMSTDGVEEAEVELSADSSTGTDSDALAASSDSDSSDVTQDELDDLAAQQLSWRPCSKHDLLENLLDQIQHINDVAALMYYWTESSLCNWSSQLDALGLSAQHYDSWAAGLGCHGVRCRLSSLEAAIYKAFLLGWDGFVDFEHDKHDVANKWQEFKVFSSDEVPQDSMKNKSELVFLCVLYQLQQLPAQDVLVRLHGMLSRCCRCDLLLLLEILEQEVKSQSAMNDYDADWVDEPESDVVMAFAQVEPLVAYAIYGVTTEQKCSMVLCIKGMVESFVARSKWSGPLEFLCHGC